MIKTLLSSFIKNDQNISGTTRLILIQKINYHQIKSLVFDNIRKQYNKIGELSRFNS